MTINPIKQGNNTFCGPAVISAITGISTDEAEAVINSVRGKDSDRKVTGVYNNELSKAFESLGWKAYNIPGVYGRTIYSLMFTMSIPGVYLFFVSHHVIAIEITISGRRYIIDNHTKNPLNLSNSARIGQKVIGVTRLEKVVV